MTILSPSLKQRLIEVGSAVAAKFKGDDECSEAREAQKVTHRWAVGLCSEAEWLEDVQLLVAKWRARKRRGLN